MSDLIDFNSPNTNNGLSLASPLIPAPKSNASSEAGPHFSEVDKQRGVENNPFDMVLTKITEYEKNQEDPFERVCERAMLSGFKDDLVTKRNRRFSDILKMNKTLDETDLNFDLGLGKEKDKSVLEENDMSIIVDLNNTNLIEDDPDSGSHDGNVIPIDINIFPPRHSLNCSILDTLEMDDSLLDHKETSKTDFNFPPKSESQNIFASPRKKSSVSKMKRSLSVNDENENSIFGEDCTLASTHSSAFDDPLNNAFRKTFSKSSNQSHSSSLSFQCDSIISKQRTERLNSDSSVFSGLSNVSSIPMDIDSKIRLERFWSETSTSSGISNISTIPTNNTISSCETFDYSNSTINKAFLNSRSKLDSTSFDTVNKKNSLKKTDKSDLIKKFFEIKTRMSISQTEQTKDDNDTNLEEEKESASNSKQYLSAKNEKLIDVDNSSDSVFNDPNSVDDIIVHEARALAQTFEKMASMKISKLSNEKKLRFKDLPQSVDDAVVNLIELPASPYKASSPPKINLQEEKKTESNELSSKEKIKALENEFIEQKDPHKKAMVASLLLDLENLIKEENDPNACKILTDLEKLLGVNCDNNTEILKVCLQKTNEENSKDEACSDKNVADSSCKLTVSNEDKNTGSKNSSSNPTKTLKVTQKCANNEAKNISKNVKSEEASQVPEQSSENEKNSEEISEDQKLAITFLKTLNNIINEKNEASAVNVLQSLGSILSMATELRSISKENENFRIKKNDKVEQKTLNRSTNSAFKSSSPKVTHHTKAQNKPYESSQRRSVTNILTHRSNSNLLEIPVAKNTRKSELLNMKKRFPSDPGLLDSSKESKKIKSPKIVKPLPSPQSKKQAEELKSKLKKKINPDIVTKKGPLKAMIPLGNMQKRASFAQKMSVHTGNITPPKSSDNIPTLKIPSSTPIANVNNNFRSQPKASSTPNSNVGLVKHNDQKIQAQPDRKSFLTTRSTSLNSSLQENASGSKINNKRMERTLSPQKRPQTPRKSTEINSDNNSKVPRYSPRPIRVRNYSMNDLKTAAKSPQTCISGLKTSSEQKIHRSSLVLSPLKNYNKLAYKARPLSLTPKTGKLARMQSGLEKENCA